MNALQVIVGFPYLITQQCFTSPCLIKNWSNIGMIQWLRKEIIKRHPQMLLLYLCVTYLEYNKYPVNTTNNIEHFLEACDTHHKNGKFLLIYI